MTTLQRESEIRVWKFSATLGVLASAAVIVALAVMAVIGYFQSP